jgi:TolA-binding protein
MMFRNAARGIVILAVTTVMAQATSPAPTVPGGTEVMQRQGNASRRALPGKQTRGLTTATPLRQRVQDMESTLAQMHVVLKQMQDKLAKSKTKDSLAKANLDMWGLMVGHLEKDLQELKIAMAAREDMEARRAALYKQADVKAEAEAQAARSSQAAKFGVGAPTPAPAGPGTGQSPAAQTVPGQPSPTPPASNSPAPN